MNEFLLRRENSPGLKKWVHIEELALHNNNQIRVNSFNDTCPGYLRFYYVPAYPAAFVIKQTRQKPGAEETYLQSDSHYWLNLYLNSQRSGSKNSRGKWSHIFPQDFISARNKLFLSIWPDAGLIRRKMKKSLLRTIKISI